METPISFLHLLLTILGLISLLRHSLPILHSLYALFLRPPKDLKTAYGPWAVVTGATDGIGRAIAVELAHQHIHLILVGRNPSKLKKSSDIITTECCNTQVRTVVWDLSDGGGGGGGAERLRQAMVGVEVGVLVNAAGITYPGAAYFHEVEERVWRDLVRVNVEGLCHVQVVLMGMVGRRRGAILNVGSASSVAVPSFPFYAVYAATKA